MRYKLYREQQLSCDVATAWEFFSAPENLSKITPKDMGFTVLSERTTAPIFEGMQIDYVVSPIFKIPVKWRTRITHVKQEVSFIDFQEKGPYKYWSHFHEFIPNEKGVLMKDTVEYELPLDFLGTIAHKVLVKNKLSKIFDYRYQVLESMFNQKKN